MRDGLQIQRATDEERDWASELLAGSEPWITLRSTVEQCRKVCWDSDYSLYIAHLDNNPCGLILLHPKGLASSPYIKSIAVADNYRRRGVGASLMEFAENYFRKESKHLFLCVSSFNTKAKHFYEHIGYLPVGEFKNYVSEGASEILLHKRLR